MCHTGLITHTHIFKHFKKYLNRAQRTPKLIFFEQLDYMTLKQILQKSNRLLYRHIIHITVRAKN